MRTPLLSLAALVLAGCSTTGGTALGLVPLPKFLDGEIEGDTYIGGDGAFRVALPHPEDSYEFTYMEVKEQTGAPGEWYVSFGPAALDQSIYRLEIGLAQDPATLAANFDRIFEAAQEHYVGQLEQGYGTPVTLVAESRETLDGKPARFRTYTQVVPADSLFTHEIIALDLQRGIAMVWVQIPPGLSVRGLSVREFAASVVIR